jgi:hypothetical protein
MMNLKTKTSKAKKKLNMNKMTGTAVSHVKSMLFWTKRMLTTKNCSNKRRSMKTCSNNKNKNTRKPYRMLKIILKPKCKISNTNMRKCWKKGILNSKRNWLTRRTFTVRSCKSKKRHPERTKSKWWTSTTTLNKSLSKFIANFKQVRALLNPSSTNLSNRSPISS